MQPRFLAKLSLKMSLLHPQKEGEGAINVGLLGENCHKITSIVSESLLLNEDVVPLLWNTSYNASLSTVDISQISHCESWLKLMFYLKCFYTYLRDY